MRIAPVVALLVAVIAVPFLLRPEEKLTASADHTLVIISPHNEAIRWEFANAFRAYCRRALQKEVALDWRTPGGTSEIARYLDSQYLAGFEYYWTRQGRKFGILEKGAFANGKIRLDETPTNDTPEEAVRRAYLTSKVSSGIDLFFGGGSFDFAQQASKGHLVDNGLLQRHPEWFGPNGIPQQRGGEAFYDAQGRWFGACLSSFGICYNGDSLQRLRLPPPANWADLAHPGYFREIALADPTKSGSNTKAFEMIIQQQIGEAIAKSAEPGSPAAVSEGWTRAVQLIQKIGANGRYFTDSAPKVPLDVSSGDAAAGMCIDFYGRFQSEAVRQPDGNSRIQYVSPANGSSTGSDPIGLLRGAPNSELAKTFIDFVLSEEGQKLWNTRVGSPGGPQRYALRRLPIRPELYDESTRGTRSDPDVLPYAAGSEFNYQPAWTGSLFRQIGFIVRVMCIEPHDELQAAWAALIAANFPPEATAKFQDVEAVSYAYASGGMKTTLSSPNKIEEVRLAKSLSGHFQNQYREARRLAEAGK
ncbi:MAG TPA: extracellular solute-binding protein [Chthoniobacterales bacterium]|jgi:ABC-type Fe3+ transport system substrate-binding protein